MRLFLCPIHYYTRIYYFLAVLCRILHFMIVFIACKLSLCCVCILKKQRRETKCRYNCFNANLISLIINTCIYFHFSCGLAYYFFLGLFSGRIVRKSRRFNNARNVCKAEILLIFLFRRRSLFFFALRV